MYWCVFVCVYMWRVCLCLFTCDVCMYVCTLFDVCVCVYLCVTCVYLCDMCLCVSVWLVWVYWCVWCLCMCVGVLVRKNMPLKKLNKKEYWQEHYSLAYNSQFVKINRRQYEEVRGSLNIVQSHVTLYYV